MKNGYRVVDIDTHVNPSLDTLIKYVDPSFRPRLDEFKPYIRTVGEYNALSIASIPFDRFPGEAPSTDDQAAVAGGRGALPYSAATDSVWETLSALPEYVPGSDAGAGSGLRRGDSGRARSARFGWGVVSLCPRGGGRVRHY